MHVCLPSQELSHLRTKLGALRSAAAATLGQLMELHDAVVGSEQVGEGRSEQVGEGRL